MPQLRIGAYVRVSTDFQANVFEGSLESQKFRIEEFMRYKNSQSPEKWGVVVDYYVEEGISAGTTNRPEYQRLMADIRSGRINMILVSDLTRLSRNLLDFCNLIGELEKHHASYLSMKEQFDTSTPIGRMIVYIIIALGQFERETTSERVSMNCHTRAVKGFLNGGRLPLGYDRHPEKSGLLLVNEEEAEIVRTIFQIFLEEGSRSRAIHRLNEKKIRPKLTATQKATKKIPRTWTVQTLRSVLQNVVYIGRREVNKLYKDKNPDHLKPWQKHQMVKAPWEPILDEKTFFDAQQLLEEATTKERARINQGPRRTFLLTGLLTCGELGLPLLGQTGKGRSGTLHRYYHYARTPKGVTNVRPRLHAEELEEKVIAELKAAISTQGYFDGLAENLKTIHEATHKGASAEYKRLQKELTAVQENISMVWVSQSRMQLSEEALRLASDELNRLAKEKQNLEVSLLHLGPISEIEVDIASQVLFVENQIRLCMQGWQKAPPAVRKRLLRRTIKEIVVTRDELYLTFWTSAAEQFGALGSGALGENGEDSNVVLLRRLSPAVGDHNLSIIGSEEVRNGRGRGT